MIKNKTMFAGCLCFSIFALSGCNGDVSPEKNLEIPLITEEQKESEVNQKEYEVDQSDFVHSNELIQNIEAGELDDVEKAGLILMREEEKLAHDVYTVLYEKWGQNIFNNISDSEQTHTDSIKTLLDKYEIADPVKDDTIGKFTSTEMQAIYTDLVAKGEQSLKDALAVGATVEDLDIKDLRDLLVTTDNEDIQIVYQNLMKGSRNHMRAFTQQIERNGGTYSAVYITDQEYQEILDTEQERGSVGSGGAGTGNGSGGGSMKNNSQK